MDYLKRLLLIGTLLLAIVKAAEGIVKERIDHINTQGLKAYVLDKNGKTLMSVGALVVDASGIIMIDSRAIKTWLEDVSHNLIVRGDSGEALQIDRLIALSKKHGKVLASLEMQGRRFDRISEIGAPYTAFIKKAIETYKKSRKALPPEATVMAPPITPTPPPVVLPTVPEVKAPDIGHYKEVGKGMLQSKRFADAEAPYKKALEIDPKDKDALLALALIYTNTGRFEEAESIYRHYYGATGAKQVLKRLGTIYVLLQKYDAAISSLIGFLKSNPYDTDALYTLALTYMLVGNHDEAFNHYLKVKRVDKKRAEELFEILYR